MTRIFTDGAEMGDVSFWDAAGGIANIAGGRSGNYLYRAGNAATKSIIDTTELYFRFGMYFTGAGYWDWLWFQHTGTTLVYFGWDGVFKVTAKTAVAGGTVGTSIHIPNYNTWHLFEIYIKIDDNPNGRIVLKIDAVTEIDFTGDTLYSTYNHIDSVLVARTHDSSTTYYDDFALNDTNGIVDNSWCGNGYIEKLTPNANGDINQFTGNDGNQTDNYLLVDEAVPDGDTTYTSGSEAGQRDMYGVSDFSSAGKSIKRIWAEARVKDFSYSAKKVKIGYNTSGSIVLSGSAAIAGTWGLLKGEEALTNISASAAWTEADLDAIQFVIESQA